MKIQIVSDLHQEFGYTHLRFDQADLVVFAGDTHVGTKGIEWVKSVVKGVPVIYILGNPHGYPDEKNTGFNSEHLLDIHA